MDIEKNKIKILLIDNDEMMRIYFRDVFWIHGRNDTYNISMAYSLEEAEKIILDKETQPDTIFLDILIPISGQNNSIDAQIKRSLSFVEKIKNNKDLSNTKIIIYSSHKEKSVEKDFYNLGVSGYLLKGELMPKEIIDFTDKIHESNN